MSVKRSRSKVKMSALTPVVRVVRCYECRVELGPDEPRGVLHLEDGDEITLCPECADTFLMEASSAADAPLFPVPVPRIQAGRL